MITIIPKEGWTHEQAVEKVRAEIFQLVTSHADPQKVVVGYAADLSKILDRPGVIGSGDGWLFMVGSDVRGATHTFVIEGREEDFVARVIRLHDQHFTAVVSNVDYRQTLSRFDGDPNFYGKMVAAEQGDVELQKELEEKHGQVFKWNQDRR